MDNTQHIESLCKKISQNSDQQAFKELYLAYFDRLYKFAFSILHSAEFAEEAVNDVFLNIWQKRSTLKNIASLSGYLFISTKNTSFNYLSKFRRERNTSLDDVLVRFETDELTPETAFFTAEIRNEIEQAINQLPPKTKLVFQMAKVEGMKYKEIADILNISVNTIDNHIATAVKKLSVILKNLSEEDKNLILFQLFTKSTNNNLK
ncbi:MAG: RNA polymerase sigma-70 factor [Prolixibacteraceae bacterium]|nr:RNA polymerase sigma-70 factor [Prolixibacteraceae bacterium]